MERRTFLTGSIAAAAGAVLAPDFFRTAIAQPAAHGTGPYGPLLTTADANGLLLPEGFTSRIVAVSGEPTPTPTAPATGPGLEARPPDEAGTYLWHNLPDGAATFPTEDDGWILVSNAEVSSGGGGASALRFTRNGTPERAYPVLSGTSSNCAGGPTPWGTWLSCEELASGRVWECDPNGEREAVELPQLGTFYHEAAAVDPLTGTIYMTEDAAQSGFFRWRPRAAPPVGRRPDFDDGVLEIASVTPAGEVQWLAYPITPEFVTTRDRPAGWTPFVRGEGAWYFDGTVYFCCTDASEIWAYEVETRRLEKLYGLDVKNLPSTAGSNPPLTDADNITVASSGDLFITIDPTRESRPLTMYNITPERIISPFAQHTGHAGSELTGVCFNPKGDRLYFASQRGGRGAAPGNGIVYEVTGPFRKKDASGEAVSSPAAAPTSTGANGSPVMAGERGEHSELPATGGSSPGLATLGVLAALGGVVALRNRSSQAVSE